ncbi:MAG: hypothetical protein IJ518_06445 [Clostridia bacterium]|nr:hypothetical protein [Clostridia bacterium]
MLLRLRNTLIRFMAGRYGMDSFGRFLMGLYLGLWVLSLFFPRGLTEFILSMATTAVLVVLVWRMLSRNIPRRQAENQWFLRWWYPTADWLRRQKDRLRDIRRCRYRRCPHCKAWLRLPIKRGRRTVTCARCRTLFKAFFL